MVGFCAIVVRFPRWTPRSSGETGLELTYENTMHDLIASTIGALAGGVVTAVLIWPRRGAIGRLFGWRLVEPGSGHQAL